jgi:hypothetical protein
MQKQPAEIAVSRSSPQRFYSNKNPQREGNRISRLGALGASVSDPQLRLGGGCAG